MFAELDFMFFGIRAVEHDDMSYGRHDIGVCFGCDVGDHFAALQPVFGVNPELDQLVVGQGLVYFVFYIECQAMLADDNYRFQRMGKTA